MTEEELRLLRALVRCHDFGIPAVFLHTHRNKQLIRTLEATGLVSVKRFHSSQRVGLKLVFTVPIEEIKMFLKLVL